MSRSDKKISQLIAVLDHLELTWLANEIRAMATTPQSPAASANEVERAQLEAQHESYERRENASANEACEKASYADCLNYLSKRVLDTAEYLQAAGELLAQIGPQKIRISHLEEGLEMASTESVRFNDATTSLRRIHQLLKTEFQLED